jgi:hypothetical protein
MQPLAGAGPVAVVREVADLLAAAVAGGSASATGWRHSSRSGLRDYRARPATAIHPPAGAADAHGCILLFLFNQPQPALPGFGIEERHTNIDPFITKRAGSVTHDPVKRTRSPNTRQCCGLFWNFTT